MAAKRTENFLRFMSIKSGKNLLTISFPLPARRFTVKYASYQKTLRRFSQNVSAFQLKRRSVFQKSPDGHPSAAESEFLHVFLHSPDTPDSKILYQHFRHIR